ncbi:DUF2304 domain-containing protein [Nanoarchaeota archaeon]
MFIGVRIIGLMFGFVMIYLTFLYYKRANYDKKGLIAWFVIWLGFLVILVLPQSVYGVMEVLQIERTADFFYISGFLFFSVILFHVYVLTKSNQKQLEVLVRKIAYKQVEQKGKKK